MDNNQGTFPMQSERFFAALQGHGATVRYVTLPYESHGYAARESVLHTIAEMVNWADKYLKAPAARPTTTSSR
jgi:dipeptidyl aminopeptidase/acylaminoacyl peptidase